ncbi:MAG: LytR C-terminal domain-containing protein [Sphingomicrobium sp.]
MGWLLCASGTLLATGCTGDTRGIKVRAIESASSKIRGGPAALAEAQGLLNLGNPGLALEAFRKAQREQPGADALAGIAACYVAMGRDDLAKTNLEAALALAPQSPELLRSIALVMDRLGLKVEAANAQQQARDVLTQPAPPAVESVATIMVESPLDPQGLSAPSLDIDVAMTSQPITPATAPDLLDDRVVARAVAEAQHLVETEHLTSSVSVKLPPARTAVPRHPPTSPRLERLSGKEVALVTSNRPFWAPRLDKRSETALVNSRWKPLPGGPSVPNIRLLNAARVQGFAGAARSRLLERGWRKIEIGDFAEVRVRSVVLYPANKRKIGTSLARHFGIASAQSNGPTVTVLLGRDIARPRNG